MTFTQSNTHTNTDKLIGGRTPEDLLKSFECCNSHSEGRNCSECPMRNTDACAAYTAEYIVQLINQILSENKALQSQVNRLKKYDEERDIRLHARLIATSRVQAITELVDKLEGLAEWDDIGDTKILYMHTIKSISDEMIKSIQ